MVKVSVKVSVTVSGKVRVRVEVCDLKILAANPSPAGSSVKEVPSPVSKHTFL